MATKRWKSFWRKTKSFLSLPLDFPFTFSFPKTERERGALGLPIIVLIMGAVFLFIHYSYGRSKDELAHESYHVLEVDKELVKRAIRTIRECPEEAIAPCTAGQTLSLSDSKGKALVASDGRRKIGRWNVKIECLKEKGNTYWVSLARKTKDGFARNPLSGKADSWKPAFPFHCSNPSAKGLILSATCYGLVEGRGKIPAGFIPGDKNKSLVNSYCLDEQVKFRDCPPNFRTSYRTIDRFGWAGMDFAKFTYCEAH